MNYNILEVNLKFENSYILKEVAVLYEIDKELFVSIAKNQPISGYYYLKSYDVPTVTLFQKVVDLGMKLESENFNRYFPFPKVKKIFATNKVEKYSKK